MDDELQTISQTELMKDIVGIEQIGVPYGLFNRRIEPGFVLKNGIVLLECEKDENGHYIGGAGMDGMYLRTPRRYEPIRDKDGKITSFRSVGPDSVLNRLKTKEAQAKNGPKPNLKRKDMER